MTVIFIIIIIFALAVWFVASPLSRKQNSSSEPNSLRQRRDLLLRKEEVLNDLKELELDHQMKKLNEPDYKNLFEESLQQGAEILKEIEKGEEKVAPISTRFCIHCGAALHPGGKFCAQCGVRIMC